MTPNLPRPLVPADADGHHFLFYGDCCSGRPGHEYATAFAAINAVAKRAVERYEPQFVCFLGDNISGKKLHPAPGETGGITDDTDELRRQWRYWFDKEMSWLDCDRFPLYHLTSNHNTFNPAGVAVFREILSDLPRNGPPGQEGLAYYVRQGTLLMIFVHTADETSRGNATRVETTWLDEVLTKHADARHKIVFGHHPMYPVNGFDWYPDWNMVPAEAQRFWDVLVRHDVLAYLCSHVLAFDTQVHRGILQVTTSCGGVCQPPSVEYQHLVQACVDEHGLHCQTIDVEGRRREWIRWPFEVPPVKSWTPLEGPDVTLPMPDGWEDRTATCQILLMRFRGVCPAPWPGDPQTLLLGYSGGNFGSPRNVRFTLEGARPTLNVGLVVEHPYAQKWTGPVLSPGAPFDVQVAIHPGMGPGGIMWRRDEQSAWSSMVSESPRGAERNGWTIQWKLGHDVCGPQDKPFTGEGLRVTWSIGEGSLAG